MRSILLICGLAVAVAAPRAEVLAFTGAMLLPVAGPPIDGGTLVVEDGRIRSVGADGEVRIPRGAELIPMAGRVIMPGLVDTHSHVGEVAGADRSGPIQPDVRVIDSINVRDPGFDRARAGGITTANLMAGSGYLLSGQTVYLKLRDGNSIEALAYRFEDGGLAGGMKMANGTNSRRDPPFPGTRARSAALVRAQYVKASEYLDKLSRAGRDDSKRPARDLGLEALGEVLSGKRVVHHHTHRHDDILTVLRLAEEFGFRVVLHHVSDAWKVADEIAAAGVPVSLTLVDSPGGKIEALDNRFQAGAALEQAGAQVAFHTDDYITDSRVFLRMAAMAVRAGMSRDGALRALTLAPAEMIDLGDRIGSLEKGKDADFVVLSGDPFSVYTRVLETWVEGRRVFDLDTEEDRRIAEGAYGVLTPGGDAHGDFHGYGEEHR